MLRSLHETIRVFCSNAESCLGCGGCRKLRLVMGFESCIWDIQYQLLKKQLFIFWKRGLSRFGLCTFFLKASVQICQKCQPMSPKPINIPLKMTLKEAQSLRFELCFACFSSCEWKSCCEKFEINVRELIPFFVRLQCWVLPALVFGGYVWYFGSLHPAFEMSCDSECLEKQLLIFFGNVVFVLLYCVQLFWWFSYKSSEKYWAISPNGKHRPSKTTLSTFQKCLFELSFAFFFGCNYQNCFETFMRSLYLEQNVFFVLMKSHVSASPVLEGYVWYFGSLHPAFEMSWDIEYL